MTNFADSVQNNLAVSTVLVVLSTVLGTAKSYIQKTFEWSCNRPRSLAGSFISIAYYFAGTTFSLAAQYSGTSAMDIFMRSCFLFSAVTMGFGPFLVLMPTKKVILKKETFFKKLVRFSHKKETRYTFFVIFCLITIMQGFVTYSLWHTLNDILGIDLKITIGCIVGYVLVCLFYLVIFYSVMMRKEVVIANINLLDQLRTKLFFRKKDGTKVMLLDTKAYLIGYITFFCIVLVLAISGIGVMLHREVQDLSSYSTLGKVILFGFFVFNILAIITFSGFILNVAFDPISKTEMQMDDGKIVDVNRIKYFALARSADRTLLLNYAVENDPDVWIVSTVVKNQVKTGPTAPGYQELRRCEKYSLFQQNDLLSMFFLATGPGYNEHLGFFFIDKVQVIVEENYYHNKNTGGMSSYNMYPADSLSRPLHDKLDELAGTFSQKESWLNLYQQALESQMNKQISLDFQQKIQMQIDKKMRVELKPLILKTQNDFDQVVNERREKKRKNIRKIFQKRKKEIIEKSEKQIIHHPKIPPPPKYPSRPPPYQFPLGKKEIDRREGEPQSRSQLLDQIRKGTRLTKVADRDQKKAQDERPQDLMSLLKTSLGARRTMYDEDVDYSEDESDWSDGDLEVEKEKKEEAEESFAFEESKSVWKKKDKSKSISKRTKHRKSSTTTTGRGRIPKPPTRGGPPKPPTRGGPPPPPVAGEGPPLMRGPPPPMGAGPPTPPIQPSFSSQPIQTHEFLGQIQAQQQIQPQIPEMNMMENLMFDEMPKSSALKDSGLLDIGDSYGGGYDPTIEDSYRPMEKSMDKESANLMMMDEDDGVYAMKSKKKKGFSFGGRKAKQSAKPKSKPKPQKAAKEKIGQEEKKREKKESRKMQRSLEEPDAVMDMMDMEMDTTEMSKKIDLSRNIDMDLHIESRSKISGKKMLEKEREPTEFFSARQDAKSMISGGFKTMAAPLAPSRKLEMTSELRKERSIIPKTKEMEEDVDRMITPKQDELEVEQPPPPDFSISSETSSVEIQESESEAIEKLSEFSAPEMDKSIFRKEMMISKEFGFEFVPIEPPRSPYHRTYSKKLPEKPEDLNLDTSTLTKSIGAIFNPPIVERTPPVFDDLSLDKNEEERKKSRKQLEETIEKTEKNIKKFLKKQHAQYLTELKPEMIEQLRELAKLKMKEITDQEKYFRKNEPKNAKELEQFGHFMYNKVRYSVIEALFGMVSSFGRLSQLNQMRLIDSILEGDPQKEEMKYCHFNPLFDLIGNENSVEINQLQHPRSNSQYDLVLTPKNNFGNAECLTIYSMDPFPQKGICIWEVMIEKFVVSHSISIGISQRLSEITNEKKKPEDDDDEKKHKKESLTDRELDKLIPVGFLPGSCGLLDNGDILLSNHESPFTDPLQKNDLITIIYNAEEGSVSFARNGKYIGRASMNIRKPCYACITFHNFSAKVRILGTYFGSPIILSRPDLASFVSNNIVVPNLIRNHIVQTYQAPFCSPDKDFYNRYLDQCWKKAVQVPLHATNVFPTKQFRVVVSSVLGILNGRIHPFVGKLLLGYEPLSIQEQIALHDFFYIARMRLKTFYSYYFNDSMENQETTKKYLKETESGRYMEMVSNFIDFQEAWVFAPHWTVAKRIINEQIEKMGLNESTKIFDKYIELSLFRYCASQISSLFEAHFYAYSPSLITYDSSESTVYFIDFNPDRNSLPNSKNTEYEGFRKIVKENENEYDYDDYDFRDRHYHHKRPYPSKPRHGKWK
ncbi:protein diaphanous [Anaeramoeba ignava]|uniref:Protein diaphanous n=1 Tax=Anaeramoeba ignava TaxID=1746090 RepID=A0A9Q0LP67_ANAIG|nr:protein diaphanous [Anaeramoeba ignava]